MVRDATDPRGGPSFTFTASVAILTNTVKLPSRRLIHRRLSSVRPYTGNKHL